MPIATVPSCPLSARAVSLFAAPQGIRLAIGANSYRGAFRLAENARRVGHTPEAVSTLSALYADWLYAACRQRGHALTGDDDLAERARTTVPSIRRRVAKRRRLSADNGGVNSGGTGGGRSSASGQ